MTQSFQRAVSVLTLVTLMCLVGCKASEAPVSGFIEDPELMSRDNTTPFQRTYWNKKYPAKNYTELLIAPVNTDYVMAQNIWEKASSASLDRDKLKKDVQALADFTRQTYMKAANDDPKHRFQVVDRAGPKTLILELAITQLVPSKPALNALGYVSWVPAIVTVAGSAGTQSEDTGKGVIAIEGRIRDGSTGEIIGMFADREHPKSAIVDLQAVTWWSPAKGIVEDWSKQLIEVANRPPGGVVKDTPAFELMVW